MENNATIKQNVTPEAAADILQASGMKIPAEEVKAVVDYLYGLANAFLNNEKSNSLH